MMTLKHLMFLFFTGESPPSSIPVRASVVVGWSGGPRWSRLYEVGGGVSVVGGVDVV